MSERWYAAMTKGRAAVREGSRTLRGEMAVAAELVGLGFDAYCPRFLDKAPLRCPGSKRQPRFVAVEQPLFPGYVFVGAPPGRDIVDACYARGVVYLVCGEEGRALRMPAAEIARLKASEGEHGLIPLTAEQRQAWKAGDLARVLEGPFAGFDAVVDEPAEDVGLDAADGRGGAVDRGARIRTLISLFGRLTPVRIEPWHLERLQSAR